MTRMVTQARTEDKQGAVILAFGRAGCRTSAQPSTWEQLQGSTCSTPIPHLVTAISPEQPVGPDIEDLVCPWVLQDEAVTLSLEHVGATQLTALCSLGPLHRHPEGVHCGDTADQDRDAPSSLWGQG